MAFTLEDIVQQFGGEVVGDRSHRVGSLAPLDQAGPNQLAFLANPKYLSQVETTRAGAVLINAEDLAKLGGAPEAGADGARLHGARLHGARLRGARVSHGIHGAERQRTFGLGQGAARV